jgi:AraC-like DNA-binding protein
MGEASATVSELVRFRLRVPAVAGEPAPAAAPLLSRHSVFTTRSETEFARFLAEQRYSVSFAPGAGLLDVHINGLALSGLWLGHVTYGRALSIASMQERAEYWLHISTHRRFDVSLGRDDLRCDGSQGVVLSPQLGAAIHPSQGCGRFTLSLSRDALVRQLAALLGRPVNEPLRFDPALALDRGHGRGLANHIRAVVDDIEDDDALLHSPLARSTFEQFVITALLFSHPHNYSAELQGDTRRAASRDVRRAIDYIEGHLTAPITLADIATAAGVAGRVLFKHFRRCTGTSPMAYLRDARFQRVREALRKARPSDRIVDIAALWGFDHIGRFAIEYRRRFGEKPSATKARSS